MVNQEKEHGFNNIVNKGLSYISRFVSATVFSHITQSAENLIDNIEMRIIRSERRIQRKIYSLFFMLLGGIFLIFAVFFFLKEFLILSNTTVFFSLGIIIFMIGLLLNTWEFERR